MSYSNPLTQSISRTVDFSSADTTLAIKAPPGCTRGILRDVQVAVTTTCAGATTKPKVQVGITGTLTKYANHDLGTTAAGAASQLAAASMTENEISDTDLIVTCKAATGSGAAGAGRLGILIDWFA